MFAIGVKVCKETGGRKVLAELDQGSQMEKSVTSRTWTDAQENYSDVNYRASLRVGVIFKTDFGSTITLLKL